MRMDDDLYHMSMDDLIAEVKKLRRGIRRYRDSKEMNGRRHPQDLWKLLPEKTDPSTSVPDHPQTE
jgi:hypothetical protein